MGGTRSPLDGINLAAPRPHCRAWVALGVGAAIVSSPAASADSTTSTNTAASAEPSPPTHRTYPGCACSDAVECCANAQRCSQITHPQLGRAMFASDVHICTSTGSIFVVADLGTVKSGRPGEPTESGFSATAPLNTLTAGYSSARGYSWTADSCIGSAPCRRQRRDRWRRRRRLQQG